MILRRKIVNILDLASARTNLTEEQVENLLFEYINSSTNQPGNNIDKFTGVYELTKTKGGREELEARNLLKKALDYRVITEKQSTYTWVRTSGKIEVGSTYSEAIDFLLNPKKQALVDELEEEIKAKQLA